VASSSKSISSSSAPSYTGVVATNFVPLTLGVTTWIVNNVASFGVGDRVQITWTADPTDFMIGNITAVDRVGLTITVNADTLGGDTGIPWSPWAFSLIAAANPQPPATTVSSTSVSVSSTPVSVSSTPVSVSSTPASGSSASVSSSAPAPSYSDVVASDFVSSAIGTSVWHVNMVASFAVNDRVMISWTVHPSDNMIGDITAVDPVGLTITVNVDTVNGQTGVQWTPWAFTLISSPNVPSSSGGGVSNAADAAVNHQHSIVVAVVTIISALSGLLLL